MEKIKINIHCLFEGVVEGLATPFVKSICGANIKMNNCLTAQPAFSSDDLVHTPFLEIPLKWIGFAKNMGWETKVLNTKGFKLALAMVYGEKYPRLAEPFKGSVFIRREGIKTLQKDYRAAWTCDPYWKYAKYWHNFSGEQKNSGFAGSWKEAKRDEKANIYSRDKWEDFLKGIEVFYDAIEHNTELYKQGEKLRLESLGQKAETL